MLAELVLAGDLGATKTFLGVFSKNTSSALVKMAERKYQSNDYSTLEEIVRDFLSDERISNESIALATFGVAGPVIAGRSKLTNLGWELDERLLSSKLGLKKVRLLNDLVASATYIPFLKNDEKQILFHAENSNNGDGSGASAMLALGTGLGESFHAWDDSGYHAHASEGGHADFAPSSALEDRLLKYLRDKFGHVSYERVCSGKGMYNVWSFFHNEVTDSDSDCRIGKQVSYLDDPVPIIVQALVDQKNTCRRCADTLDTFLSILGAELGNVALKFFATNGVYLAGGMALQLAPVLKRNGTFRQAFLNKGRMSEFLSQIPISVITTHRAVLLGAAHYAYELMEPRESKMSAVENRTIFHEQRIASAR